MSVASKWITGAICSFAGSLFVVASPINRQALVERNCPVVTDFDPLSSLSVGNGEFAFTVDPTGLQTFPEVYAEGVCLGTQAQWGWHFFPNTAGYTPEETLVEYDFGRGHKEPYSVQSKKGNDRHKGAVEYFRANPHRLHLATIGLELPAGVSQEDFSDLSQRLDLWSGAIKSHYKLNGKDYDVTTVCHPDLDMVAAEIKSTSPVAVSLRYPYPTGLFGNDGCNWEADSLHAVTFELVSPDKAIIEHRLDSTVYYTTLSWEGKVTLTSKGDNYLTLTSGQPGLTFTCRFSATAPADAQPSFAETATASASYWANYWTTGGAVDFSACTDPRAKELERRVVLSQYLLGIQCAGSTPPQETGLTYNSWFGKFHLEMIWWHQAQFALWNRPELLDKTLGWYRSALPAARDIARRQGFKGARWMKMTDPSAVEAPSSVGSFLIWQQPHIIHLAELLYRNSQSDSVLAKYAGLVEETADFMASFASFDSVNGRYILKGIIPAQETLKPDVTFNSPMELSYWHAGLRIASEWRRRQGLAPKAEWDEVASKLSSLPMADSLYLAAESAPDTYSTLRLHSDHMAMLGACGMLPPPPSFDLPVMKNTLDWVMNNWNWGKTWGWDFPLTAMCAARIGEPQKAVDALLLDKPTNRYLPNGHNYQDGRLRIYLPGNGGLLTAVAMMCAGWDGSSGISPGFPSDGTWDVKWENLHPLP